MNKDEIINWLLDGDVAVQYQVHRDLFESNQKYLQDRIAKEGWGANFIKRRNQNGHWGQKFYQPKWTSTHYTLLDLKNLGISPEVPEICETLKWILDNLKSPDGGILPIGVDKKSDICVCGMFLNYACYFGTQEEKLESIVDFLLSQWMADGGFNCLSNTRGAKHSSLHTTLSVLEGILEYSLNGYKYRLPELKNVEDPAREFILQHRLFRSDHTGEIIDKRMLMLSYPSRWRYDILRTLDYFQCAKVSYDPRMKDAIDVILKKRSTNGRWRLQARHSGQVHFDMEKTGEPSRWNTLRALRVLKHFNLKI